MPNLLNQSFEEQAEQYVNRDQGAEWELANIATEHIHQLQK